VPDLVLRNARTPEGLRDVEIGGDRISGVVAAGTGSGTAVEDLDGMLLLPAFAEPHAHLDKAFTADVLPNPAGDLLGAVETMRVAWPSIPTEDVVVRAGEALRRLVASGTTAVRTHADLTPESRTRPVAALLETREQVGHLCEVEIVAMAYPVTGLEADDVRLDLDRALERGVDLVGGVPHLEDDPHEAMRHALHVALGAGVRVDLHMDEVWDGSLDNLAELARLVEHHGLQGRVTASHCVAHGAMRTERQTKIAGLLADAGIDVVTLPRTNLYMQGRDADGPVPRGLPGIDELRANGVLVAAGGDNVQDPFYPVGRTDPLEVASFLVAAAHFDPSDAVAAVGGDARALMDLEPVSIDPGSPAELVALTAGSPREAVADQPGSRIVIHRGQVVARSRFEQWIAP
jgi:cytosine deaminase